MQVLYFAWVRQKVGVAEERVSPPPEVADVAGLVRWLSGRSAGHAAAFENAGAIRAVHSAAFRAAPSEPEPAEVRLV